MKKCPFCLKIYEKLTDEHIFPKAWYPDDLPPDIEKWKVPSCENCNSKFGKFEQEVLLFISLCSDPSSQATRTISQRVLRSFNPKAGRDERDRNARLKKAREIIAKSFPVIALEKQLFPGFGYHEGFSREEQRGLKAPKGLDEIGEKFIRGIEYKLNKRFIDNNYLIRTYFCHKETIEGVIALIRRGKKHVVAPTIEFYRLASPRGDVLFEIRTLDKLIIYGSIIKSSPWERLGERLKFLVR